MERQSEPLLGEIEVVRFAQASSDVAQRHDDAVGIADRDVHIGLEQDLVTVGVIEREHRADDVLAAREAGPRRSTSIAWSAGRTNEVNVLFRTSACERPVISIGQLVGLDDASLPVEHDHRIRQVVEQGAQLCLGVPEVGDVVLEPHRQAWRSGTRSPSARR